MSLFYEQIILVPLVQSENIYLVIEKMGRVYRLRKRRRRKSLAALKSFQSVNEDPIYVDISQTLHRDGWKNETKLKIGEFAVTGRGVYSPRSLRAHDLLISLPIESLISIVTMERDTEFRQLMNEIFDGNNRFVTSQSLLTIYLLYLKHHRRKMDYINTVPNSFSVPYFCTKAERSHLIRPIMEKILHQQEIIQNDFESFGLCFGQMCCNHCNRTYHCDIFTLTEFEWAFFAVNSRSVYFSPDIVTQMQVQCELRSWLKDEPTLALAPFLDLLNHSSEAKTTVAFKVVSSQSGRYELYTAVPFRKYEQIFISYGALDNTKLLTDYGFFLPNNSNDFVEINASDTCLGQYIDQLPYRMKMFVKNNKLDQNLYISRANGLSHNLKLLIYIVCNGNGQTAFHENECKRMIYGASDELDMSSIECRACASNVIGGKINEMELSTQKLNELKDTNELSEQSTIYCNYLQESLNWMANLKKRDDNECLRVPQI